jgi:hypothetical protein
MKRIMATAPVRSLAAAFVVLAIALAATGCALADDVDYTVDMTGTFEVQASPTGILANTSSPVTFTVTYEGQPVPAGTTVTFTSAGDFTGIPASAQAAAGGTVEAPAVAHPGPDGLYPVQATVGARTAIPAFIYVSMSYPLYGWDLQSSQTVYTFFNRSSRGSYDMTSVLDGLVGTYAIMLQDVGNDSITWIIHDFKPGDSMTAKAYDNMGDANGTPLTYTAYTDFGGVHTVIFNYSLKAYDHSSIGIDLFLISD